MSLVGRGVIEALVPGSTPWAVAHILLEGDVTAYAVLTFPWADNPDPNAGKIDDKPAPVVPHRGLPEGELSVELGWRTEKSEAYKAKVVTWLSTNEVAQAADRYKQHAGKRSAEIESMLAMMSIMTFCPKPL